MSTYDKFEYENFNEETKRYLNKVMDIYSSIMNKDIILKDYNNYELVDLEKKLLSIYLASFLVECNLKHTLEEFNEIKIDDLLTFFGLNREDIKELEKDVYRGFYNIYFDWESVKRMDSELREILLIDRLNLFFSNYDINIITPEIIFLCTTTLNPLNDFNKEKKLCIFNFSQHESFKRVEEFALKTGSLKKINTEHEKIRLISPNDIYKNKKNPLKDLQSLTIKIYKDNFKIEDDGEKEEGIFKNVHEKTEGSPNVDDEKIWSLLDDIQKKFIGQETAAEYLFYNIVNNQQLASREDVSDGERSIIFLDGPTGTGKTAITREITNRLGIPFTSSTITNYSSTGYVGGDITDTLKDLLNKSGGDLKKAERGIIVFDEFDKIAYSRNNGLEMKRAVQQQLLDFMGGGKYRVSMGPYDPNIEFDTSKLTFVCLGALSDLREKKTERKQSIGFTDTLDDRNSDTYSINPQDLINIGLERELVGRFNTYLHTEEYSKEDLLRILKESTISPMIGFEKWINSKGKKLIVEDGVYEIIAETAYDLNTGARALQTIINNIRTPFIKEVLRGKEDIFLSVDTIINIKQNTLNRKARR